MIEWLLEADRALKAGDVDDAERRYLQATESDPRNAIAVVGLGRVALARGDATAAAALIERALAIDPENAAARRHAADLAERVELLGSVEPMPPPPDRISSALMDRTSPPERGSFLDRLLGRR